MSVPEQGSRFDSWMTTGATLGVSTLSCSDEDNREVPLHENPLSSEKPQLDSITPLVIYASK
jgi:hypothetical protein